MQLLSRQFGNCKTSNQTLHLWAIYRPPDTSEVLFINDFIEFMGDVIAEYSNLIVVGDFNIHINKDNNPNASIFMDTMVALGLKQHTKGSMHRSGNCLDLVFTEELSRLKVINCVVAAFVSDHAAVDVVLDIRKDDLARNKVSYRKLNDINIDKFIKDLDLSKVNGETVDEIVNHMELKMKSTLDKHATVITKDVTTRKIKPWFNSSIKTQKRKMRHSEKLFRRLRTDETWKVFDEDRKKYQAMLYALKTSTYSEEIKDCKGDTKKLYKLVYSLMGTSQENLLPGNDNPEDSS